MKNLFIAFEGIDGSGKSTQIELLAQYLRERGQRVHTTCEPSGFRTGRLIREYLRGEDKCDGRVIAALFTADRLDHILNEQDGMKAHMDRGETVLTDRYYFSSFAYQSADMEMGRIIDANLTARELLKPDLTIFIDITPECAMDRISKNRDSAELYENLERLTLTRDSYFEAFERLDDEERVAVVDGEQGITEIALKIREIVEKLL